MAKCNQIILCGNYGLKQANCQIVFKIDEKCSIDDGNRLSYYSPTIISNKFNHIINGNHTGGIKFLTWNKGNCYLENKIEAIKIMIDEIKLQVFSIHEARLRQGKSIDEVQIPGYELHTDGLYRAGKTAREIVYTS